MTVMLKHIGKVVNTDGRCIVAWMQIPNKEDHALVINTDALPPHYERPIRQLVESIEGQAERNFGDILSRRLMPDTSLRIIDGLAKSGLLQPVHIDNIVMMPRPSMAIPLRQVISAVKGAESKLPPQTNFATEKFNPHAHNQAARSVEERVNIARNLMAEADELKAVALKKVEKAYSIAPELRPATAPQTIWTPPTPALLVIEDNVDIASPIMEFEAPELRDFKVETATANTSDIERYADMMMGLAPEHIQTTPFPTEAAKPARKTTAKPKKSA